LDQTIYFDISKLDKELEILLNRYYNSSNKQQKYIDLKIATFLDIYNLYSNIREYCIQYREPTSVLDYVLLYSRLGTILASKLLFIQLDLQGVYNFVEFSRDIESLVEYQEVKLLQASKFIENLENNLEDKDVPADLTASEEKVIRNKASKSWKQARLDTIQLDYLYYKELRFELYIYNKYLDYQAIKEAYFFPEVAGPVYLSRNKYQIYILTAVNKEDDISDNSEDTKTEID
jgi:hypothetical protein